MPINLVIAPPSKPIQQRGKAAAPVGYCGNCRRRADISLQSIGWQSVVADVVCA